MIFMRGLMLAGGVTKTFLPLNRLPSPTTVAPTKIIPDVALPLFRRGDGPDGLIAFAPSLVETGLELGKIEAARDDMDPCAFPIAVRTIGDRRSTFGSDAAHSPVLSAGHPRLLADDRTALAIPQYLAIARPAVAGAGASPVLDVYGPAFNAVIKLPAGPTVVRAYVSVGSLSEAVEEHRGADVQMARDKIMAPIASVAPLEKNVRTAAHE